MNLAELYSLSQQYLSTLTTSYQRKILHSNIFLHRLSIIIGARGIGKTTLILQYLLETSKKELRSKDILYLPTDHLSVSAFSLYEIAENFYLQGGKTIAFDEIHKYPTWSKELKSIYDTFPTLKIIASGSSALEVHKGSHDLTRRAIVHTVHGLSFREYLELSLNLTFPSYSLETLLVSHEKINDEIVKILANKNYKVLPYFKQYLSQGYYPYFIDIPNEALYFRVLEQNSHTTIESDLSAIYPALTGNSTRKIKQLLTFLASSVPFIPNFKKLSHLLDIGDERTLKTYFKYLEDAGLIRQLLSASQKLNRLETPEKIYLNNPNQCYAICLHETNIGTLRELFFLSMLAPDHDITIPNAGDFLVDKKFLFEIGGKKKTFEQIKAQKNAYLACDEIERGIDHKIPLWLFGFLY